MNGSDFDDNLDLAKTTSYRGSDTYNAQREVEAVRTFMDSFSGLLDFSGHHTNIVEAGSQTRSNIRGSCHATVMEVANGSCRRKHNSARSIRSESNQQKAFRTKQVRSPANLKFACPFFKKDPSRFTHRQACSGPGFSSISRLKEHIYRAHKQPDHQCIRCYDSFMSRDLLEEHQRAVVPCKITENNVSDDINEAQYIRLRRKPTGQKTDAERWEEVYRIIFPKASNIPSCYYESQDIAASALKAYTHGLKQVENALMDGVRRDLDDRFNEVGNDLKADFLMMVQKRVGIAIQEFLNKNEDCAAELPALSPPADSPPIDMEMEPPGFSFETDTTDLPFNFQNFNAVFGNSQYMLNEEEVMDIYQNSPNSCSSMRM